MIAIIDYGMGNLISVRNALEAVGAEAQIVTKPAKLQESERIILPGVGSFPKAMANLEQTGWRSVLEQEVRRKGKPFLGICLGMQVLAETGYEHTKTKGLGWISGEVKLHEPEDQTLRIPHIGWNDVEFCGNRRLSETLDKTRAFYFVHSYVLAPADASVVTGVCEYGVSFTAMVEQENVFGVQFHPEKSQKAGLELLKRFCEI